MLRFLLIFFILLEISAFSNTRSNFDIISEFNSEYSQILKSFVIEKKVKEVEIQITKNDLSNYLKNELIKQLGNAKINISDNSNIQLKINSLNCGVLYKNHTESTDSIIRIISYNFNGNFSDGNLAYSIPEANYSLVDTIYRFDINIIENRMLDFAHNDIPKPEPTFFENIVEPIAIIATAALTVFLLFTLRTQ